MSGKMAMAVVFVVSLVLGVAGESALAGTGVDGVVTANKLNVRVRRGTKYSKVATLSKGDKVRVLRYIEGWYEIAAPSTSSVWVSARLVENGFVVKRANLRAGPSVAFSSYRIAEPGEKIVVVDSTQKDWLKISPPYGLTAWVSADYVRVTPQDAAKLLGKKKVAAKGGSGKTAVPAKGAQKKPGKVADKTADEKTAKAPSSKPSEKPPLPFLGEGSITEIEGKLLPVKSETPYVTHTVAVEVNGEYFPLCYIHVGDIDITSLEKREVVAKGRQRFVRGWRRPVMDLMKIKLASELGADKDAKEKDTSKEEDKDAKGEGKGADAQ